MPTADAGISTHHDPKSSVSPTPAPTPTPSRDHAGVIESAKRRVRSELKAHEWRGGEFATRRAAEFEALLLTQDNVPRESPFSFIDSRRCTKEQFAEEFERPKIPCIIKNEIDRDAWGDPETWSLLSVCREFGSVRMKCGEDDDDCTVRITLADFARYAEENTDDSPLYIFDVDFDERAATKRIADTYTVPKYFKGEDLFDLAPRGRPPHKWFLLGPKRSGMKQNTPYYCTKWSLSVVRCVLKRM